MLRKSLFFALLIAFCFPIFAEKYKISQDANLRKSPNKNSEIVTVLKAGTICEGEISQENNNWYLVKTENNTGYIHKSLVESPFDFLNFINNHPIFVGICIFLFLFVFIRLGRRSKCPQCKRWFAEKKLKKEFEDSGGHYETVIRTDIRRNGRGEQIGTTERSEQVHMTTNYYRQHCKCKFCGYTYSYRISKTFEG